MKFPAKSVILATILLTACNEEIDSVDVDSQAALEAQEIIDNLIIADYPESEIELRDDNTVLVGGDTVVTLEASREIAPSSKLSRPVGSGEKELVSVLRLAMNSFMEGFLRTVRRRVRARWRDGARTPPRHG